MSIAISGMSGTGGAIQAMSGASAGLPPQQKMTLLYDKIDNSGSGSISQDQFNNAFQSMNPPAAFQQQGASAVFAALDPGGTGSVSKSDFVSGMSQLMASLRAGGSASGASSSSPNQNLAPSIQFLNSIDPASMPSNGQPGSSVNISA